MENAVLLLLGLLALIFLVKRAIRPSSGEGCGGCSGCDIKFDRCLDIHVPEEESLGPSFEFDKI